MITPGLAKAVASWVLDATATVTAQRIAGLKAERHTLITGEILNNGLPSLFLTQAGVNGKFFQSASNLNQVEKLTLIDQVLDMVGDTAADPITFIDFSRAI